MSLHHRPIKKLRQRRVLEALGILTLIACVTLLFQPSAKDTPPQTSPTPAASEQSSNPAPGLWHSLHPLELARRANQRELERMNSLLAEQPNNVEHLYRRSWLLGALNDADAQLRDLNRVIELRPEGSALAYNDRARLLAHQGHYHEALEDIEKTQFSVFCANAQETEAYILIGMGRDEEVLPYLNVILTVEPRNLEALWERATVLDRLGREDEAQADWDRAYSLDPDYSLEWPVCTTCHP